MTRSKQSITKQSKSKAQHYLDRQAAIIKAPLSSGNVGKYEFMTRVGKRVIRKSYYRSNINDITDIRKSDIKIGDQKMLK